MSSISEDIDSIIARAMAEYSGETFNPHIGETVINSNGEIEVPVPSNDVIPENSKSILVEETTSRFSGAVWYNNVKSKSIILAGCGGIGSYVGFLLSRLKPRMLSIYDDDIVEAANMSGQFYGRSNIGELKTSALCQLMANFSDFTSYVSSSSRYTSESENGDIMICGFDNMEARKVFFNRWYDRVKSLNKEDRSKCLFIDGRLAAETLQVLCLTGNDEYNIDKYTKNWLFSDREADVTLCSYKQTSFMANMIGSIIVNLYVNFCANECDPLIPRDVPFLTEYIAETMYFKVEN